MNREQIFTSEIETHFINILIVHLVRNLDINLHFVILYYL
jgi:hypothetical protein